MLVMTGRLPLLHISSVHANCNYRHLIKNTIRNIKPIFKPIINQDSRAFLYNFIRQKLIARCLSMHTFIYIQSFYIVSRCVCVFANILNGQRYPTKYQGVKTLSANMHCRCSYLGYRENYKPPCSTERQLLFAVGLGSAAVSYPSLSSTQAKIHSTEYFHYGTFLFEKSQWL